MCLFATQFPPHRNIYHIHYQGKKFNVIAKPLQNTASGNRNLIFGVTINYDMLLFSQKHSEGVTNKVRITVRYTEYKYTVYRVIQEKKGKYFERALIFF